MTTTEQFGGPLPPPPPPPSTGQPDHRLLRRSTDDRIAAGVAGGLGEYFGVDPVLFRVLFATAAFFGGAGVLAYLVAWVAIPERGTVNAPIDRFVSGLRRRRIPVWLVAVAAGLFLWAVAFSWWAPGHFFPLIALVIVLVAVFGGRGRSRHRGEMQAAEQATPDTATVRLEKGSVAAADPDRPVWVGETRQWLVEAKAASRERRRRAWPVKIATFATLVVTIAVLAAIDAATGIPIPTYFWVTFGITLGGLLAGLVLRRTPWALVILLIPSVAGLVAFAPTSASLHDGSGQHDWAPTSAGELKSHYRLAFGRGVLDLSDLHSIPSAQTVDIRLAAGQVRVLLPATLNATVHADVHLGNVEVDGNDSNSGSGWHSRGWGVNRTVLPGPAATGAPLTINVDLADGNVSVEHVS
jgi:phage shock protein PspC (stress-responsive transcriptional regulator)